MLESMPSDRRFDFLKRRDVRRLSVFLLLQAVVFHGLSRSESTPPMPPLLRFAEQIGDWKLEQESSLEAGTFQILQPDDYLIRSYTSERRPAQLISLYVAYFKTQRTGHGPHSPVNCLPGSGWVPSRRSVIPIPVEGAAPIHVNQYLVSRSEERSVVLYWYQTPRRVIASEYLAKAYLAADAIRYNRTDTALVRIVAPIGEQGEASATEAAIEFARAVYPLTVRQIPAL